jgi:predicted TIM-barrel fold metal-dependent hydrolase
MSQRMVVITTDSHIGRADVDLSPYFDPVHRGVYREQLELAGKMQLSLGGANMLMMDLGNGSTFMSRQAVQAQQKLRRAKLQEIGIDGFDEDEFMSVVGDSDPELRRRELEADGTVGAVLFPQGGAWGFGRPPDEDVYWAGIRAYNRWMADFVSSEPERWAATIAVDLADIGRTVEEVRWAKENGLRGGAFQSGNAPVGLASYNTPYYDPLWAVLEDLGLPYTMHAAFPADHLQNVFTNQRGGPALLKLQSFDVLRKGGPLGHLVFGGVFDRFPKLKMVIAETGGADWIIAARAYMDQVHEGIDLRDSQIKPVEPIWDSQKEGARDLPRKPSDYISDNVFVQLHAHGRDWSQVDKIGVQNLVWGSDFPHAESTWPDSMAFLGDQIARNNVSLDKVETILSRNPAAIYGFDLAKLRPIADRVGPDFSVLGAKELAAAI